MKIMSRRAHSTRLSGRKAFVPSVAAVLKTELSARNETFSCHWKPYDSVLINYAFMGFQVVPV